MEKPFALHTTWTCYGAWLPGDERGHVSDIILPSGSLIEKQNVPGTPILSGDAYTRSRSLRLMKDEPVWLNRDQARIVAETLR